MRAASRPAPCIPCRFGGPLSGLLALTCCPFQPLLSRPTKPNPEPLCHPSAVALNKSHTELSSYMSSVHQSGGGQKLSLACAGPLPSPYRPQLEKGRSCFLAPRRCRQLDPKRFGFATAAMASANSADETLLPVKALTIERLPRSLCCP